MTDISTYHRKTEKQFLFNVQSNWVANNNTGTFYSNDVKAILKVGLNNKFGGTTKEWTPEHIFLSAIGSSFMTTFMLVCEESKCHINYFECNIIGQVKFIDDACQFTQVDVFAKIEIEDEELKHIINETLEKTKKHCLVAHSVKSRIIYHPEVIVTTSTKNVRITIIRFAIIAVRKLNLKNTCNDKVLN
ncbi:MAG: OsmC family protein [Chitinophagaceae bacterium]|nr:OsmC family protein [Chitinophagaceae bacterium]